MLGDREPRGNSDVSEGYVATTPGQFTRSQRESGTCSTGNEPGCSPAALSPHRTAALSLAESDLCPLGCICAVLPSPGLLRNPAQPVSTQGPGPISVIGAEVEAPMQPGCCRTIWSLHAVLHSAETSPAAVLGPARPRAQAEFSLALTASTPSQRLSNPPGLFCPALLGAQRRDNWASSTRCAVIHAA